MLQVAIQILPPPEPSVVANLAVKLEMLAFSHSGALWTGSTTVTLETRSRFKRTLAGCASYTRNNKRSRGRGRRLVVIA